MPPASPETITATKTAVFQLRSPSAWKRAAILDTLKRTHLATQATLKALLVELPRIQALTKKTERTALMQSLAYKTLQSWDLSGASAAAARVDAMGMVESYVQQLRDGRETTGLPIVPELEGRPARYAEALTELAQRHATVEEEGQLRDKLNRLARTAGFRPLSLHGYGHFYRLLRHPETDRLFAWINLLSNKSRFAISQGEANRRAKEFSGYLVEIETGEAVLCKRPTWVLFPLEFGFGFHERRFLLAGKPAGGRLVYRPEEDRFELHAGFEFEAPAIDTSRRFIGVEHRLLPVAGNA